MWCSLLAVIAVLAGGVQLLFLGVGVRALRKVFSGNKSVDTPPVSVVICARNEAHNLRERLPCILEQQYPHFEVVVIDDGSGDETITVLEGLQKRFSNLFFRKIQAEEKPFRGKKGALQAGVALSKHDLLLFTDADCLPASPFWIRGMVSAMRPETEIVVGYGPYEKAPGFLNAFIRAETLWSFLQVKAAYSFGLVYMAVGRNLCVLKKTFVRATQHPLWQKTLSGDDDMLMRICATRSNTAVVDAAETFMYSPAKHDWKSYRRQKQRHLSTGKYYRLLPKLFLAAWSGSHLLSWALLPFLLICNTGWTVAAVGLLLVRLLMFDFFFRRNARQHGASFPKFFPLGFDLIFALYPLFFTPYIFWKNKDQWT